MITKQAPGWAASFAAIVLAATMVTGCSKKTTDAPAQAAVAAAGTGGAATPAAEANGLSCVACEMKAANVDKLCPNTSKTAYLGTADPEKFGCNGFPPADRAKCVALLDCLRTKHCARGADPIPCLCGNDMDAPTCAQKPIGTRPGVCRDLYIAAANGGDVDTLFFSTDSPIGVANNLNTCDVDAHCACR